MGLSDGVAIKKARAKPKLVNPTELQEKKWVYSNNNAPKPALSSFQKKDAIEQGVVDRGLQSGASGAQTFPNAPKLVSSGRVVGGYSVDQNGNALKYVGEPDSPTKETSKDPGERRTNVDPGREPEVPVSPVAGFNAAEIEAALAALEAKYGLTREQLLADQTEIGDTYRFLTMNLQKSRVAALQGVDQDTLARGVLRSGINLEDRARVQNDFTQREAQAEKEKAGRLRAINSALGALDSGLASDQAFAAQGIGLEQLGSKERLADILRLAGS